MKIEYDKERQQCLKNNTEDKQIIVSFEEMTYNVWFVRWCVHFWSWNTEDQLKIVYINCRNNGWWPFVEVCDIFHYNRFLFWFWSYSSFSSGGHKSLEWFYFVTWNSFPPELSVTCITEKKKNIMQKVGTDVLNGQAPCQTAMTFSNSAFTADEFCCIHRAGRMRIWGLPADPPLLHSEESHMGLRLEKGGRRKGSLRVSLTTALHVALPVLPTLVSGQEDLGHGLSKPADQRSLRCLSSESSAQCEHILLSKITVLLLQVKIAWHTCHCSCT